MDKPIFILNWKEWFFGGGFQDASNSGDVAHVCVIISLCLFSILDWHCKSFLGHCNQYDLDIYSNEPLYFLFAVNVW
jgi:hypothetical protein